MQIYNTGYYQKDKRVGSRCSINGRDAYDTFNADLIDTSSVPGTITVDFSENPGRSGMNLFNSTILAKGATLSFYVGGPAEEDVSINVSNLLEECRNCIIATDESRFEYAAVMNAYTDERTGVDFYRLITMTFAVIRRLPLVGVEIVGSGKIYNEGNQPSGMKLEIVPPIGLATLEVAGITVKNLIAGQPFIIDGIEGRVTSNNINRFADTDLIDFPKIQPGMNEITASAQVPIKVSFYPVFL